MAIRTIAWDPVTTDDVNAPLEIPPPVGYRVFVDGSMTHDLPNIQNPSSPQVSVNLAPGEHTIAVQSYQTVNGTVVDGGMIEWTVVQPSGIPASPQNLRFVA